MADSMMSINAYAKRTHSWLRWEQMRVDYFKAHKRGNEQKLEDAEFQLSRWNLILKQRLGEHVLID